MRSLASAFWPFMLCPVPADTTSRTYLKGAINYLKVGSQRRYQLLECCGHFLSFYDKQSIQEMIIGAGEVITLKMFNIESSSSTSLFSGKTAKAATIAKAVLLPPTSYAAAQHSLRCYHQIQCWLGHTEYGYCVKNACLGKSSFARDYEEPCCTRCLTRLPKLWL